MSERAVLSRNLPSKVWAYAAMAVFLGALLLYAGVSVFTHLRLTNPKVAAAVHSAKPVQVAAATLKSSTDRISAEVTVEPSAIVPIRLRLAAGEIESVPVEVGDEVKPGQVLMTVKSEIQHTGLRSTEDMLEASKEQLRISSARYGALSNLHKGGFATDEEVHKAAEEVTSARLQLAGVELKLAQAQDDLEATKVTSSVFGVVASKLVYPGTIVRQATDVVSISVISPVLIKARISEEKSRFIRVGQDIHASLYAYPGESFSAKVAAIEPQIDEKTRLITVVGKIENNDLRLKPGMQGVAYLGEGHRGIWVPSIALVSPQEGRAYVFVVKSESNGEGIANTREILIGTNANGYTEVLDGLQEGEKVVVVGQTYLNDGDAVNWTLGAD